MKALKYCIFLLLALSGCEKKELPRIITAEISSINQTSAICGGYIISEGSSEIISKGICYSTSSEPTIQDDSITIDSGVRNFTTTLTGLELNTTYFVRAYATNNLGTSYGKTKSFTTDPPCSPEVKTLEVSSITKTSVTVNGEIISDGGSQLIDCGICWGTSLTPSLSDKYISNGLETGQYSVSITELNPSTDYFVCAYATNIVGTSYGKSFLVSTCFEPNPDYPVDPNYPTTFYKLDPDTLSQRRATFAERNKYLYTTLNDFGFCSTNRVEAEPPPFVGTISQEEATNIVKDFLLNNSSETGVKITDDLTFSSIVRLTYDNSDRWNFLVPGQKVKNLVVFWNNTISVHVVNGEITYCCGNWYPDIYIPDNFNVDQEQAKSLILGKAITLGYYGETSAIDIVTQDDCDLSTVRSIILAKNIDNIIELLAVWEIHPNSHSFIFYVDAMTGEVVFRRSTVIIN